MRAFVTGGTGFAGSHLIDSLRESGNEVWALHHAATSHVDLSDDVVMVQGDLLDRGGLTRALGDCRPDVIYHLAGQASPQLSWKNPALTLAINGGGVANILQAAVASGRPRVVIVTSADIYGPITADMLPLTERTPPSPRHPYGVSKLAASHLVRLFWERYQLPVVEARPFNHMGPRQELGFVAPDFASQIAAIKLGHSPARIRVGNLDAKRDFTDVRDVTRAYQLLAHHGEPGSAYLICSGVPVQIREILEVLLDLAGLTVELSADTGRMRPSDTPVLYGDPTRLKSLTGWQPAFTLRQSLADTLEDWMGRVGELGADA